MKAKSGPPGIHDHVLSTLGQGIVSGKYSEGSYLDPSQIMSEFRVSRTVAREVLKVLGSKGLIEARPKTGTTVSSRSQWKLLDEEVMKWRAEDAADSLLVMELEEIRLFVEPFSAKLCALRSSENQRNAIHSAAENIASAERAGNIEQIIDADLKFHQLILKGAGNELLERFEVLLEPALRKRNRLTLQRDHSREFVEAHLLVATAIKDRRAEEAEESMRKLLSSAFSDTESVLRQGPQN